MMSGDYSNLANHQFMSLIIFGKSGAAVTTPGGLCWTATGW
jgi:hypothetical protein